MIVVHSIYLAMSVIIMVAVARSLARSGRVFLIEVFGNQGAADAANSLLVVGFCVTKVGYAAIAIRFGGRPDSVVQAAEFLTQKIGIVLILLGVMHAINVAVLLHIRDTRGKSDLIRWMAKLFRFDVA